MQLLCYFYWKQILKLLAVPHDHALSPTFCMHLPLKMEADDRYYTVKKKCGALFGGFSVSTALFFNHFLLCIQYATVLVCPPHFIFYSVYISVYIIHSAV